MDKDESIFQLKTDKRELEYILNRSARKTRYKSKRSINYLNKLNDILDKLDSFSSTILSDISFHNFYIIIRDITRDLLMDWHSSRKLIKEEIYLLRNSIRLFNRLVNTVDDITKLTSLLVNTLFIDSFANCISNIDQLLYKNKEKKMFKQLTRLFSMFLTYYKRLPLKLQNEHGLNQLFEVTMDCIVSLNYDQTFTKLKPDTESLTREEKFFLIKCPSFISIYRGVESRNIIEQILGTMIPRYAFILDKHIRSINQWKSPMIHCVHHLLLIVIFARGYYTPYANGQPLQWFIDHIIRILSETSFINKIHEKSTNPETVLIDSALRTLTAFIHEPDLLIYIKCLKITSIFRPLVLLSNESILLHAYVMLSYTLEEDDIIASEKDSGRLLSKIFDSLRKNFKLFSITNKDEERIETNVSLLIESLRALVQHDQIKSEVLKQNALSFLIEGHQYFNNRSKRLLLESLGSITFDEEAARLLRENPEFISSIKDMQTIADDGIKKAADKIIWNLSKEPEREKKRIKSITESDDKKEDKPKKEEYQHDIMISYCHSDKELVYRIHKYLSDKGYKIWFDRDNIYGPAMQAMADAVENSEFVVVCMSDSYKRSVYCQAEAEYAFHCKRQLLPLIVRQGYRADGWLGLIIGSRIYVDFGRQEFKSACELIVKEITLQRENKLSHTDEKITGGHTSTGDHLPKISENLREPMNQSIEKINLPNEYLTRSTSKSTYSSTSIDQWTRKDVLDFLYDTNLHHMMPLCELMTGLGLIKLLRICQIRPNRFYRHLNEELSSRFSGSYLPIGIFTQFLSEIDRLISSSSVKDVEQDSLHSKSVSPSPPPKIVKQNPSPTLSSIPPSKSSLENDPISSSQQITPPILTIAPTPGNVQITEQTFYRKQSLVNKTNNYIVQPELTLTDEQVRQNQQFNTIPQQRILFPHYTQSVQQTIYP